MRGRGIPTVDKTKFPQNLGKDRSNRFNPPKVAGRGIPTVSDAKFPQNLGKDKSNRFNPQ